MRTTCYGAIKMGTCSRPFPGAVTKSECCCANPEHGFGEPCYPCPSRNSAEFQALCNSGIGITADGRDINECLSSPCVNGVCRNVAGSFNCECSLGSKLDSTNTICVDSMKSTCWLTIQDNRCEVNINGATLKSECCSTLGAAWGSPCEPCEIDTSCSRGFARMKGLVCEDLRSEQCYLKWHEDECGEPLPGRYRVDMCCCTVGTAWGVDCEECPKPGSPEFNAICPRGNGFANRGDILTGRPFYKDVNECKVFQSLCTYGNCRNTIGSFKCRCNSGFALTAEERNCTDIDECTIMNGGCETHCTNSEGSYECSCSEGYALMPDLMTCADVNECDLNPNICLHGDCENTKGSFICHCQLGYFVNKGSTGCTDVDECEIGAHNCDMHAACINVPGSFKCRCRDGWIGDGIKCVDQDECSGEDHNCNLNADCVNTPGSYRCACKDGFVGDGFSCSDINECADPVNCINGLCVNTPGNYMCNCPVDFELNPTGVGCVDTRVGNCFLDTNTRGDGGISCSLEIGVGVTRASCCCSLGGAWGNPCELCPPSNSSEYKTLCPGGEGFRPNPITVILEDMRKSVCYRNFNDTCENELSFNMTKKMCCCAYNVGKAWNKPCEACPTHASSEYRLLCGNQAPGFIIDIHTGKPIDIDECSALQGQVCRNGQCINGLGSFQCLCHEGYENTPDGKNCIDTRESFCFTKFEAGKCSVPKALNTTKAKCCCSKMPGEGWGLPCELCPRRE
ncbi:hypothetical protein fugu_006241 [Takifugu bimaculatus]|uniref:Fibrillin-2 n=1 Tax=Takifugu bimaculatus TaxID=433685 RepID=A0A4Z2BAG8_9TELE|nr:hypothetical protein fugu_006241 [Takifugu bimaculatus]